MNTAAALDALKCKAYPIFLEDVALMWFTRLPPRSISSFKELSEFPESIQTSRTKI